MNDGIEALVDSEGALLATVLDQTHDCIKLLGLDNIIQYVNRQGALVMELSSPSELVGQSYLARWPEECLPDIEQALATARGGDLARFTASRPKGDGSPTWWDVTVSPVRAATGTITHFLTIARDLTSEMLERDRVEAISLEMRHRLRNVLTVAGGIVALMAKGRPEVGDFANQIVERFGHLANAQGLASTDGSDQRLAQIVPALAKAYAEDAALDIEHLPDVRLSGESLQALSLCYGELATNSLKYGALRDGGRVRIAATADGTTVEILWSESTIFGNARPGGQGLTLIERLIRTAGGNFRREIDAEQMRAIITLPII